MFEALIDELTGLSDLELEAVVRQAEFDRRRVEARLAAAVAVVSARGSFRDDGYRTVRSYLKGTLNCSGSAANKIRRRAAAINSSAAVGDAWCAGRIGLEQVDLLAKAHAHRVAGDRFAEFVPQLLVHAEHLEHDDFGRVVTHFITGADADGSFDDQQAREADRSASVTVDDGAVSVSALGGSPLAAAEMKAIFDLAVEAEFERDCAARRELHGDGALAAPLPRTARQRKFDALHAIFVSSVSVAPGSRAPQPLVTVLIDHITAGRVLHGHGLTDEDDVFGGGDAATGRHDDLTNRRCSINSTPVHPDVALQAMIAGRVRRAVLDADGVVIDLGRSQRLFTGKARDAAQLLAVTCTHRGCDVPATFCDVDHRAEWVTDAGRTDQANAMPLCGVHDRWKHAGKIRSRRAANGRVYLIRPDGSTIAPAGATEPEWAEPPPVGRPAPRLGNPIVGYGRPATRRDFIEHSALRDVGWAVEIIALDAARPT